MLSGSSLGALRELVAVAGIVAALEGHEKHPTAYHELRKKYTSLMCASYLANYPYEIAARSPIFKQQNIRSTNNLDDNSFSLSKIRSEIHKLKPEDLEETIIEKSTTHSGTNRPNETPIGDQRRVNFPYARMRHRKYYLASVKQCSQKNSLNISLKQCSCVISQMNNEIT